MKKSRITETKFIAILKVADAGMQVKEICTSAMLKQGNPAIAAG